MTRAPSLAIAYRGMGASTDAILGYSRRLTVALSESGKVDARLISGDPSGWTSFDGSQVSDLRTAVAGADGVLLQYNPFSYGRWGFAPWLLRDVKWLRKRGVKVGVMVHEAVLRPTNTRQVLIAAWQWAQARSLLREADLVFTSTESLIKVVERIGATERIHHLPVGSNLPDRRSERSEFRRRLGLGDELTLVAFRTGHPSQLGAALSRAARACAERGTVLLNLGAGAPAVENVPANVRVLSPGMLSEDELAGWLAAGDIFVAPFSDGASTRRTTLMAALQHELATVTTLGPNTDRVLRAASGSLSLVKTDDAHGLEEAVRRLAADAQVRRDAGLAGRRLFDRCFQWPVIASSLCEVLESTWWSDSPVPTQRPLEAKH